MIEVDSVRHKGLKRLIVEGRASGVPGFLLKRIKNRLTVLDATTALSELPSSYRLHKLTGTRQDAWSIWVSGPWRLTFKFRKATVYDLDLEQYH